MRRTATLILGIAGAIVALVLVAVAIAVATVDVNSFAEPLAARVQAATGRKVTIGGPLKLNLSLEPTLRVDNVSLGNAEWGHAPALLRAARIEAQVALLPLLKRRFEVVRVTIVEPSIDLETDRQGRGNWVFDKLGGAPAGGGGPEAAVAPALGIGEIEIRDGRLNYVDGTTGAVTPVTIERLLVRSRTPDQPINGEFRGTVDGVPLALNLNLGSRAALQGQKWPFPVDLKGEIAGRNATLATKLTQSGTTTRLDDLALVFGELQVKGQVSIDRSGGRPRYVVDVSLPRLQPEALALPAVASGATATGAKPAPASNHVVPDQPLPLRALSALDAEGKIAIGEVALPHGQSLQNLNVAFVLRGGRLDIGTFQAAGLGGTLAARGGLRVEASRVAYELHFEGKDLELRPLLAVAGSNQEISGGRTRITIDARGEGASLHDWAASMDGSALLLVGAAQIKTGAGSAEAALDKIAAAVNPFRGVKGVTDLKCAVVRLPLRNGVAQVDRTIAAETTELGVSASGTVDFRSETLDLQLQPRVRQGIPIDVTGFADLVRVKGPFAKPAISIDPAKSVETIARIGAAIGTGGWSLLGESLFNATAAEDSPCAIALGAKPAPSRQAAPARSTGPQLPGDIGKALGRLLGR
jgi:uncharacterized protein involved in outer membrane biogenesis